MWPRSWPSRPWPCRFADRIASLVQPRTFDFPPSLVRLLAPSDGYAAPEPLLTNRDSMNAVRPLRIPATLFAAAVLLLSGCSSNNASGTSSGGRDDASPASASPALRPYYEQKLTWRECAVPGFECASMRVPLDYAHPDPAPDNDAKADRTLDLAVSRRKAEGGQRIGSLLVNPGGPGGSAIDYLNYAALNYPAPVRTHYDMVAVDPRGVGDSEPVRCLSDPAMDRYTQTDPTPDNQSEIQALLAANRTFAAGCKKSAGPALAHLSTVDAARDMDILRALLGDKKLFYVGKSYGTFLGATYAELFPSRVGRLVLDGAVDPSVSALEANRIQGSGFELAFQAFAKDCAGRAACPLGNSPAKAGANLAELFRKLDEKPLPAGHSRSLGEAYATSGVLNALYAKEQWSGLRVALTQAEHGNGAPLLALSDQFNERDSHGHYGTLMSGLSAVNCLDLPAAAKTPDDVEKALPAFRKASPTFGTAMAWSALSCADWPVKATGQPHRIKAAGTAPILVVGTTRDPATPYAWAKSLAGQLSSGVLLSYDGDGHTAYASGSACVDKAVNAYLVDGTPPKNGTKCS